MDNITQNFGGTKSYAVMTAEKLNASYDVISQSGWGAVHLIYGGGSSRAGNTQSRRAKDYGVYKTDTVVPLIQVPHADTKNPLASVRP